MPGAVVIANHLDIQYNELRFALMHPLAAPPSSPRQGQIYFDTVLLAIGVWDGANWRYGGASLDQLMAPQANVDMNSKRATNAQDPVNPQDYATMAWVLANAAGVRDPKDSVKIASNGALPAYTRVGNVLTANVNGAFPAIDTITLTAADAVEPSILLKDGASHVDDGIYTLTQTGSGGTPWKLTRRGDADTSAEMTSGVYVWVMQGSFIDTGWLLTTVDPIVLNTTTLAFTQVSALGQITAGAGLTKTGASLDVGQGTGIIVNANDIAIDPSVVVRKAAATIGDNASTTIDVVHGLNSSDVDATLRQVASPFQRVITDWYAKDANTVTFKFSIAPTTNQYRAVIHV